MSDTIDVLVKRPGEPAVHRTITLDDIGDIVGRYVQRFPAPLRQTGLWLIDAEGHLKGLQPNVESLGYTVVGPIVWVSSTLGGLTERQLRAGLRWFADHEESK